jgi:hypothetical protein
MKNVDGFEWLKIMTSKKKTVHQFTVINGNPDYAASLCGLFMKTDDLIRGNQTSVPCKRCLEIIEERAREEDLRQHEDMAFLDRLTFPKTDPDRLQRMETFLDSYAQKALAAQNGTCDALKFSSEISRHIDDMTILEHSLKEHSQNLAAIKEKFEESRNYYKILADMRQFIKRS